MLLFKQELRKVSNANDIFKRHPSFFFHSIIFLTTQRNARVQEILYHPVHVPTDFWPPCIV